MKWERSLRITFLVIKFPAILSKAINITNTPVAKYPAVIPSTPYAVNQFVINVIIKGLLIKCSAKLPCKDMLKALVVELSCQNIIAFFLRVYKYPVFISNTGYSQ